MLRNRFSSALIALALIVSPAVWSAPNPSDLVLAQQAEAMILGTVVAMPGRSGSMATPVGTELAMLDRALTAVQLSDLQRRCIRAGAIKKVLENERASEFGTYQLLMRSMLTRVADQIPETRTAPNQSEDGAKIAERMTPQQIQMAGSLSRNLKSHIVRLQASHHEIVFATTWFTQWCVKDPQAALDGIEKL